MSIDQNLLAMALVGAGILLGALGFLKERREHGSREFKRGDCVVDVGRTTTAGFVSFGTGVVLGPGIEPYEVLVFFDRWAPSHTVHPISIPSHRLRREKDRS